MSMSAGDRGGAVRHAQRAAGQASAVATMIAGSRPFADVAQQLLAARGSLDSLLVRLVELELEGCVPNPTARREVHDCCTPRGGGRDTAGARLARGSAGRRRRRNRHVSWKEGHRRDSSSSDGTHPAAFANAGRISIASIGRAPSAATGGFCGDCAARGCGCDRARGEPLVADLLLAGGAMTRAGMAGMMGAFAHPLAAAALVVLVVALILFLGGTG